LQATQRRVTIQQSQSEIPASSGGGSRPSLTVFFPAFNDSETLPALITSAAETLNDLAQDYEIIVVDDGSTDSTPQVLEGLQRQYPFLRVVRHPRNLGYGAALRSGFSSATKQLVFYTDGDGQYDVGELRELFARLEADVDVVNGYKLERADPALRTLIGKVYQRLTKALLNLKIRDVDCDFRLIRRPVLDAVSLTFRSGAICAELMAQIERAGFRIVEVPVHHYPRRSGQSQFFRLAPVARTIFDISRLWVRLVILRRGPVSVPHRDQQGQAIKPAEVQAVERR
jgi:glycosyltransferase involved in cell wall biosynthesis